MSKPQRAGGEVDAFCTKCRMVLNHRIIAMMPNNTKPARVECSTCSSHHNYRAGAPGEKAGATVVKGAGRSAPVPRAPRAPTKAAQALLDRERSWERAIAGRAMSDFRVYRVSQLFKEGDLVRHSKFGDGVVTRVIDAGKVEILFKDEPRTLAQGLMG